MFYREIMTFMSSFFLGVFVHSLFYAARVSFLYFSLLVIVGIFLSFFRKRPFIIASLYIVGFAFGAAHFSFFQNETSPKLQALIESTDRISLQGSVSSEPSYSQSSVSFFLDPEPSFPNDEKILIRSSSKDEIYLKDFVRVSAQITSIENFETETGRSFDYIKYLEKDGVFAQMSFAKVQKISSPEKTFRTKLFFLKKKLISEIKKHIPEPHAGLIAGVLFGEKSALNKKHLDDFRRTGLMHIVVLSGYNVSLVIVLLMSLFSFLPKRFRAPFVIFGIISFALLTGAGVTVLRASLMALCIVLAQVLDRKYHVERALVLVAFLMVLWNPMILVFDISFQLSFLASYGLIVLAPYLEKKLSFIPSALSFRDSAVASISAQIMVLPLLLYSIGDFSLVSVFVNILVLFAVPWLMLFGFLTSLISLFGFPLFLIKIMSFASIIFSKFIFWLVQFFSQFEFSVIQLPKFSIIFLIILYYFVYRFVVFAKNKN